MCTLSNSWESFPLPLIDDLYFAPDDIVVLNSNDYVYQTQNFNTKLDPSMSPPTQNWMTRNMKQEYMDELLPECFNSSGTTTNSFASPTSSTSPEPRQINKDALRKKMERDEHAPTVCAVCGSPASCYHYSLESCNSCKTFFRRSIVLRKKYQCKFDMKCDIKNGARCRSCRYDRCLIAGMDASSIKFEDKETANAVLNDVNKRKRDLSALKFADEDRKEDTLAVQAKFTPRFDQTSDSRTVDFLAYLELKFKRLRESLFDDTIVYDLDIGDLLKRRCELGNADKYETPKVWPNAIEIFKNGFNSDKRHRHWLAFDLFLSMEYLKALPFFYGLDSRDQEALMVHTVLVNATIVQGWYSYKQNSRVLVHPDGMGPMHMRPFAPISKFYPEVIPIELENFSKNIDPFYRVLPDDEQYNLLKAIICCHADTPGLSEHAKGILEKEREKYAATLLRRMQGRLGTMEGARKYAEIIALVQTYFHYAQKKREFHFFITSVMCQENRKHKEPLLFEYLIKNSSKYD